MKLTFRNHVQYLKNVLSKSKKLLIFVISGTQWLGSWSSCWQFYTCHLPVDNSTPQTQCHFMQGHTRQCKVYVYWAVTRHMYIWDLLHATVVTQGWNSYPNNSQPGKLTMEKFLLPLLKPATFRSWVWHSTTELSLLRVPHSRYVSLLFVKWRGASCLHLIWWVF